MSRICSEYLDTHPSDLLTVGDVHSREEPDEEEDEEEDEDDREDYDEDEDTDDGYSE